MTAVRAARVFTGSRLIDGGWVHVAGDRIVAVGADPDPAPAEAGEPTDLGDVTLAPGFVDVHCHGGGGTAFTEGVAAARTAAAMHHLHGTTTVVASLVTDGLAALTAQVDALAPLVASGDLAGIHLEGPWLAPRHAGAHQPALLRDPDPVEVTRLLDVGGAAIAMVTVAPERPGGLAAVRLLTERGVAAALGHSDATYAQAREAIGAGARVGTHLFNAMRRPHHREPGLVLALVEDERVIVELIADGTHLHPAVLAAAARRARDRFVLVSDATAATGVGDGDFRLGPLDVTVRGGTARLTGSTADAGTIAGSTLTLDRAVRHAVYDAGLPLPAVLAAATGTPARLLRRDDIGRLAPGAHADLVALDGELRVTAVMRRGSWLPG